MAATWITLMMTIHVKTEKAKISRALRTPPLPYARPGVGDRARPVGVRCRSHGAGCFPGGNLRPKAFQEPGP
jgi:hypothetical protein